VTKTPITKQTCECLSRALSKGETNAECAGGVSPQKENGEKSKEEKGNMNSDENSSTVCDCACIGFGAEFLWFFGTNEKTEARRK